MIKIFTTNEDGCVMKQKGNPLKIWLHYSGLTAILGLLLIGTQCSKPKSESIYDPNDTGAPTPVIDSIVPPTETFAGVGVINIYGQNFAPRVDENLVYFNSELGEVLSATSQRLEVKVPNLVSDSVIVKVAVQGAYLFAQYEEAYKLKAAAVEFGGFGDLDDPYALVSASDSTLYVSLMGNTLLHLDAAGDTLEILQTITDKASGMRIGPDGGLYYVNIVNYVLRLLPISSSGAISYYLLPGGAYDLDFDAQGHLYCGGNGGALYRVDADGSVATVGDYSDYEIKSVRVFHDTVFVVAQYVGFDSTKIKSGVWKQTILDSEGTLGEPQLVFNWDAYAGENYHLLSITFSSDGVMFLGADGPDAITLIYPDGTIEPLYPEILVPPASVLMWGYGPYLYVNRHSTDASLRRVIRIDTGMEGEPYYGRP